MRLYCLLHSFGCSVFSSRAAIRINPSLSKSCKLSPNMTTRGAIDCKSQVFVVRIIGATFVEAAGMPEYRYEVRSPDDKDFEVIDCAYSKQHMHRHHCYRVRLNDDNNFPKFDEIIEHLDYKDWS
jgi:hypothetical protein